MDAHRTCRPGVAWRLLQSPGLELGLPSIVKAALRLLQSPELELMLSSILKAASRKKATSPAGQPRQSENGGAKARTYFVLDARPEGFETRNSLQDSITTTDSRRLLRLRAPTAASPTGQPSNSENAHTPGIASLHRSEKRASKRDTSENGRQATTRLRQLTVWR